MQPRSLVSLTLRKCWDTLLLIYLINFTLVLWAIFDCFDTFTDGWLGVWVWQIKIKDHLSPTEIDIGAELGNVRLKR